MGAYEPDKYGFLRSEIALIEKAIAAGRPVLGICLGAQLIAQVLGARVYPGEKREVGWGPITLTEDGKDDPLFVGDKPTLDVFHLHGDTYELPPDARNLASTTLYEQQAFRWGDLVYGPVPPRVHRVDHHLARAGAGLAAVHDGSRADEADSG
jgi:GMP synthase (glutamine-hydrolysing)